MMEDLFEGNENCFLKLLNKNKNTRQYEIELIIAAAYAPYLGTSNASNKSTSPNPIRSPKNILLIFPFPI